MTRPTLADDSDVFFSPSTSRVAVSLSSSSASSSSTAAREPPARPRPAPALEVSRRASASASPARLPRTSSLLPPPRAVAEAATTPGPTSGLHAPGYQSTREPAAHLGRPLTPADQSERTDTKIPFLSLPPILPLPSLEEASEGRPLSLEVLPGGDASDRDTSGPSTDPIRPATSHTLYRMPYDQARDGYADRTRLETTVPKSHAFSCASKANTAVQLDNAQNFEGARLAYAEACDLLQQVLLRTSGDDDQKKLEAIRRTYASRIDELDQMGPWTSNDTNKALPARPESTEYHPSLDREDEDEEVAIIGMASTVNYGRDDASRSPVLHRTGASPTRERRDGRQRETSQESLRNTTSPPNAPLRSAFSRSPARLRQQTQAVKPPIGSPEETLPQERSFTPGSWGEPPEAGTYARDGSQNSWLDAIDESGGSSGSSVHSRTSSMGYRRKHLRGVSGNTENEFDTALDAAIEAAYDDGYEPMGSDNLEAQDPDDDVVNKALRKVEMARERVRQTEREAYGTEKPRQQQAQPIADRQESPADFYDDDDSSEEEERMLEEMTRGYGIESFIMNQDRKQSVSRPESRGATGAHRQTPSDPASMTDSKPLPPIEKLGPRGPVSKNLMPAAPPPMQSLPELPAQRSASSQSVRNRRLSGQNPKQLKIETSKLRPPPAAVQEDASQSHSRSASVGREADATTANTARSSAESKLPESPPTATLAPAQPMTLGSPPNSRGRVEEKMQTVARNAIEQHTVQQLAGAGGASASDAAELKLPREHGWLRGGRQWVHPRGGYLSTKLFVPRDVWKVKGVKLKYLEDKIANCDYLTAALLKLAKVDTCDADAVLEEMQSLEGVLEQVQATLTRKLGSEVGVHSSGSLFREASNVVEGDGSSGVPRASSISSKSSSFSWRRLRSKNSAVGLGGAYNSRLSSVEGTKEVVTLPTLPMTAQPTSRPAKRDVGLAQFSGPNAHYMGSLARLFDAAQAVDQIARQVEDPGLRHADKTQVGLELCTRHAAEFFGFYVCRFVLTDVSLLLDKFIKRGSEWVLS
ncbi:hypothetical protein ACCO45_012361 [Purpureocillium lilacinum]|uniref:Uncharacterized protein n=1 Tax=Purpureocillium lilacinum TaxID=33203 RepID=A0ACC4DAV7_PURLI